MIAMLACPICQNTLARVDKSFCCSNRHNYDIAKEGYVNLHVVQHKKSHTAGDTPSSVQARRRFLSQGFYEPLRAKIRQILSDLPITTALDIGCGEGYYTSALAQGVDRVVGLDIAKTAIATASRTHKTPNITWVVGTGSVIPVVDGAVDICTSFFSPLPKDEILRVLKGDGYLLVASPAPHHLYAMREQLFEKVILHDSDKFVAMLAPEFTLLQTWQIDSPMSLDGQSLADLMDMTPYAYKATLERKTALKSQTSFDLTASFCVRLFQKQQP